jgi:hypothetical protein
LDRYEFGGIAIFCFCSVGVNFWRIADVLENQESKKSPLTFYLFNEMLSTRGGQSYGDRWRVTSAFEDGVRAGAYTYVDGILVTSQHVAALSGVMGSEAQLEAQVAHSRVTSALTWAASNPQDVLKALCDACTNQELGSTQKVQAQIGTRLAIGAGISAMSGPVGFGASGLAVYGNMISAARAGADRIDMLRAGGVGGR